MDLSPQFANKQVVDGESGAYKSWSAAEFPLLAEAEVGGGVLLLKPGGFALPHFADCSKLGFVLQGEHGVAGMVLSYDKEHSKEEIVLGLRKGDVIPVPSGACSWWYNNGDSDLVIVFIGETSKASVPGEFTYFFFTGALGSLGGFSTEFIGRAYNMNEKETNILTKSQTGALLVKLGQEQGKNMPLPRENDSGKWVKNIIDFPAGFRVEKAGTSTSLTGENFPFLDEVGLSCSLVKLDAGAMLSPMYTTAHMTQVFYVIIGSGRVEITGVNGKLALDSQIEAGHLLVVPRFFAVAIVADGLGIECFSIKTSARPSMGELASKQSALNVLSASVLQTSLNVDPAFVKELKDKMATSDVLIPPLTDEI